MQVVLFCDKHIDQHGVPCHGPQEGVPQDHPAARAPRLSLKKREEVNMLLRMKVPRHTIMDMHNEQLYAKAKGLLSLPPSGAAER